jgi:DNA (cytosine-5)-methyltransferase 1
LVRCHGECTRYYDNKKGEIKQNILEAFQSIGYRNISIAILESAAYGVPQIRPRAIFIANRFGCQILIQVLN